MKRKTKSRRKEPITHQKVADAKLQRRRGRWGGGELGTLRCLWRTQRVQNPFPVKENQYRNAYRTKKNFHFFKFFLLLTDHNEPDQDPSLTTLRPPPQTTTSLLINLHKDALFLSAQRQPRLHHHDYSLVLVQTSAPTARLNINRMSANWPRTRSSTHHVTQGTYAHGKLCVEAAGGWKHRWCCGGGVVAEEEWAGLMRRQEVERPRPTNLV